MMTLDVITNDDYHHIILMYRFDDNDDDHHGDGDWWIPNNHMFGWIEITTQSSWKVFFRLWKTPAFHCWIEYELATQENSGSTQLGKRVEPFFFWVPSYTYIFIYTIIQIHTYIHIYIYVYVYMYICIYVYMYICIYVYMYVSIYIYIGDDHYPWTGNPYFSNYHTFYPQREFYLWVHPSWDPWFS